MTAESRRTSTRVLTAVIVALLVTAIAVRPGAASVRLGFELSAPPVLVPIPASPVRYAPSVGANYFFYGGSYYVYADDAWYAGAGYDGPWLAVAPELIPLPLLGVPVGFYRFPPHRWDGWRRDRAPHWDGAYAHAHEQRRGGGESRGFEGGGHRGFGGGGHGGRRG